MNASSSDLDRLVEDFVLEHREKQARRALMAVGPAATAALQRGLRHSDTNVHVGGCKVLDHHMDQEAVPEPLYRKLAPRPVRKPRLR